MRRRNSRGTLRERSPGTWVIGASMPFDPAAGKRTRVWRTVHGTKRDAQRALTLLLSEIDSGTLVEPEKITLAEFLDRWLEHMRNRVRSTTFDRYESCVRCHILPELGGTRLSKIRPLHIQDLEARALKKGRKDGKGGLSAQSVLHVHRILAEALTQAVRWRLLAVNPAAAVQPPRPERPELRIPEPAVVERIITAAEGTGLHMPILLAAATGMRRGEILGLRWRAVDLERGIVRVIATLQRDRRGLGFGEPKTQRGRRSIVLPPFAMEVLRRHRKEQAEKRLRLGRAWRDEDLVVTTGVGGPMDPGEVTRGFRRLARETGAEGVRFHDLRHAYATMLLASGIHPKIASEALGHSTIGITLDTYSHVLPTMQMEAAEAVEQALGSIGRPKPSGGAEGAVRPIRSKDLSE